MVSRLTTIFILLFCSLSCSLKNSEAGMAKGTINIPSENISVELKYAYARKVNALGGQACSLLLTEQLLPENTLKQGDDLNDAVGQITRIHFLIDEKAKIRSLGMAVVPQPGINYRQ
jgi:hypothetical protein